MSTLTPSTRTPEQHAVRRRWAGLAVLSASLLVVVMDMTILNLALPDLSADLRPSSVQLLWIVDSYALVLAGLLVTASALGDRWGRKRMLIGGFAVFGLGSLGVLLANSSTDVIVVRALLGVGGAMIMPSTLSLVRALFVDPRERATALGVWGATAAVGAALGPIVGGALLDAFSWHAAFLFNVPVMIAAIVAAVLLLPESRSAKPGRLDAVATALSIVGMVSLVFAVKHVGAEGLDVTALATGALAVVALTTFVRRCLGTPDPMLEIRLFANRSFTAGVITALCTSIALVASLLLVSQWLQLVQGWSPLQSGLALLPMAVGGIVGSPLAPAVAERIGARTVLAGGLAVGGVGFLMLFVLPEPLSYVGVAAALALVGISTASLAVASAVIMAGAPVDQAGSAAAIEESSYEIGGVLGIAVLGSLAAAIYRAGLPAGASDAARESLAGALEVAGSPGSATATEAMAAFTQSLGWFGLAGAVVMLGASVAVWWLTPRDLDLSAAHH